MGSSETSSSRSALEKNQRERGTHGDEVILPSLDIEHVTLHHRIARLDLSVLLLGRVIHDVLGDLQQGLSRGRMSPEVGGDSARRKGDGSERTCEGAHLDTRRSRSVIIGSHDIPRGDPPEFELAFPILFG